MMDLREKVARQILWLRSPGEELGMDDPEWETADAILAIPEIKEALARKCDICDELEKPVLLCNDCAQIIASDY